LPSNELIAFLANAKELLEPTDTITPATKKVLAGLPKVEEFAVLVEKEAAEKALPVEKEKEVPVVEKEPEKKTEPTAKKETLAKEKAVSVKASPVGKKSPVAEKKETNTDLFIASVTETPGTMAEICKRPWNAKGGTFYNVAKQLIVDGVLVRDEKTKVFSVK